VSAGSGAAVINFLSAANELFIASGAVYSDTIIGFAQANGDRIHLAAGDTVASSTLVNGGQDTLITLSNSSTILLKGVANLDPSFFS
jgi:hypothetical protein